MRFNSFIFAMLFGCVGVVNHAFSQDSQQDRNPPIAKNQNTTESDSDVTPDKNGACSDGTRSYPMLGKKCRTLQYGRVGMMYGMMDTDKVELNVTDIDDGVVVKWTSSNKETVIRLQEMGQHMKTMHPMMNRHMDNARPNDMLERGHMMDSNMRGMDEEK